MALRRVGIAQQAADLAADGAGVPKGHQNTAVLRQQFRGVPIRSRNHGLTRAKGVSQRARSDLRLVEVGRNVEVRRADEFLQLLEFYEAVVENDALLDLVLFGQDFQAETIGLAALRQLVGMRRAQDDINDVREFRQNLRESVQDMLNSLVGRKQPEGEQHRPSFHAKLVLVIIGIHKRDVGNAMRNEVDLGGGRPVNILQHLASAFGHGHQPGRVRDQFLHHAPLGVVGLAQEGMERGDDGHFQFAHQRQQMAAGGPAVNPKLVLNADDVHVADVDEVRRALVGREILLFYFETHDAGILVPLLDVIDRHRKALALGVLRRHRGEQVGREGGDAALAR